MPIDKFRPGSWWRYCVPGPAWISRHQIIFWDPALDEVITWADINSPRSFCWRGSSADFEKDFKPNPK